MDCSCHEPAVFGHLECDLAPRGHMTEHSASARRTELCKRRNSELAAAAAIPMSFREWRDVSARIIRAYNRLMAGN